MISGLKKAKFMMISRLLGVFLFCVSNRMAKVERKMYMKFLSKVFF